MLFRVGEVAFFEAGAKPLDIAGCHVSGEGSYGGHLGMVGQFGGASAAAEETCEERYETNGYCGRN